MNADRWKEVTHIYDAVTARGPHERADAVGEILVGNPTINEPRPQFRFYI